MDLLAHSLVLANERFTSPNLAVYQVGKRRRSALLVYPYTKPLYYAPYAKHPIGVYEEGAVY